MALATPTLGADRARELLDKLWEMEKLDTLAPLGL